MNNEEEIFKIEPMDMLVKRHASKVYHPDKERIETTLQRMDVGTGFTYPLPSELKGNTVQYWITKKEKELNNKILDISIRARDGWVFSTSIVKDTNKKEIALKIRRDR